VDAGSDGAVLGDDHAIQFTFDTERHCLVLHLLNWCFPIESLVRSLVVVMYKLFKPSACARLTAHPRGMEAVDTYFEGVKPSFDEVSVG
jgi:hypothetical protein